MIHSAHLFPFVVDTASIQEQSEKKRASFEKSPEELAALLRSICCEARTLEQLILQMSKAGLQLTLGSLEEEEFLCIAVKTALALTKEDYSLGTIFIKKEALLKKYRSRLIPKTFFHNRRTGEVRIDHAWFAKRDKRLTIKDSSPFTPAAALEELVMSYALQSNGMVEVQRGTEADDNHYPHCGVEIRLRCIKPATYEVLEERHFIRFDKLSRLVERRVAKLELLEISPEDLQ